jgi:hypothetical protein
MLRYTDLSKAYPDLIVPNDEQRQGIAIVDNNYLSSAICSPARHAEQHDNEVDGAAHPTRLACPPCQALNEHRFADGASL